jgi:fibro-slime domain-containing protein
LGFGNEGDAHNLFYTYEIHTYLTYKGGEKFNIRSSDDLWIFIDTKIPTVTGGWGLNGIHPYPTTDTTIDMDVVRTQMGLTVGTTYRCDIFYACRSAAHPCGMKLELPAAVLCDAIQSGTQVIFPVPFTAALISVLGRAAIVGSGRLSIIPAIAVSENGAAHSD